MQMHVAVKMMRKFESSIGAPNNHKLLIKNDFPLIWTNYRGFSGTLQRPVCGSALKKGPRLIATTLLNIYENIEITWGYDRRRWVPRFGAISI
jgi:hypothetical protein